MIILLWMIYMDKFPKNRRAEIYRNEYKELALDRFGVF